MYKDCKIQGVRAHTQRSCFQVSDMPERLSTDEILKCPPTPFQLSQTPASQHTQGISTPIRLCSFRHSLGALLISPLSLNPQLEGYFPQSPFRSLCVYEHLHGAAHFVFVPGLPTAISLILLTSILEPWYVKHHLYLMDRTRGPS